MTSSSRAQMLNRDCGCQAPPADRTSRFYSNLPVFVGSSDVRFMQAVVEAVHSVVALPDYRTLVLADAPVIARRSPGTHGVFAGFDFHVGAEGPRLIEINTNAGGAMLNAAADWRHPDCCGAGNSNVRIPASRAELEESFIAMFREEWRLANPRRELRTLGIIDDDPARQFLYPEFELFADLFRQHRIEAVIAEAAALDFVDGKLAHEGKRIDLVYNRLSDFYFEHPSHDALRSAYEAGAAVITPHPHAHALFADKRNLVRLSDPEFLRKVGACEADIAILSKGIPRTQIVGPGESWWDDRKSWFFKPASGYGSRGAYRGDKLTRRAYGEVEKGGYVAQRLVPPGTRLHLKADLRVYAYAGESQLMAARLYQGQTTNFRTPGGGFAPVIELRDVEVAHARCG